MKMKSGCLVVLCSCLLAGCSGHRYGFPFGKQETNVDDLVRFQADFAHRTPASRSRECQSLRKRQLQSPQARWVLQLMLGRALSEACGDPAKLLRAYENLVRQDAFDRSVAGMAAYQAEVLKHLRYRPGKESAADRKAVGKEAPPARQDDAELLREKLEAIRSIEKRMDDRSSGQRAR